jgi:hypothetical protein
MIECYALPTANKKSGTYYQFLGLTSKTKDAGTPITNVVLIEKNGMLENQRIGIKYTIQIAKSTRSTRPVINDIILIDTFDYRINTVTERINPVFAPFWECEVKKITTK